MRLGLRSLPNPSDFGQGSNTGAGRWIGPLPTDTDLASAALAAGGYTGFYRPEDMALDPIAFAAGKVRACWTNTGNDAAEQWGEILCFEDRPADPASFPTGAEPVVTPFVIGNPQLRMPDNLDFQPGTGILYVNMDATTSAENPAFTNDDVWACLPDGDDSDTLSDGCVRVMSLLDGAAEFTGITFLGDGTRFLIHLQHRTQDGRAVPHTTDEILVSGLKLPTK
jgi:secreted PhoX family phosphatase